MTSPSLAQPFDPGYDVYSMWRADLRVPDCCHVYKPDNNVDYACDLIIEPAPELGSRLWTLRGKRILIGVYKDEGRAAGRRPARVVSWTRSVNRVRMVDTAPHHLRVGETVNVFNINTDEARVKVLKVIDAYTFEFKALATGPTSGVDGAWQPLADVNFYEQYIVFRLLPSYKLVPWQSVTALLAQCQPTYASAPVDLTDINTGSIVRTSRSVFNDSLLTSSGSRSGTELHRQQFDENGKPLTWTYNSYGYPSETREVSSKTANVLKQVEPPLVNELGSTSGTTNNRLYVYDYYGFELNDVNRAPYFTDDIITYDPDEPNNIKRKGNGQTAFYSGPLHDAFGNFVLSATETNQVVTRRPVLPLEVDQFNHPYKSPLPRSLR